MTSDIRAYLLLTAHEYTGAEIEVNSSEVTIMPPTED